MSSCESCGICYESYIEDNLISCVRALSLQLLLSPRCLRSHPMQSLPGIRAE